MEEAVACPAVKEGQEEAAMESQDLLAPDRRRARAEMLQAPRICPTWFSVALEDHQMMSQAAAQMEMAATEEA
jgi:hypothetical protein